MEKNNLSIRNCNASRICTFVRHNPEHAIANIKHWEYARIDLITRENIIVINNLCNNKYLLPLSKDTQQNQLYSLKIVENKKKIH